jgi:hypothetical protein
MSSTFDAQAFAQMRILLESMSLEELRRFAEGTIKSATLAQAIILQRFGRREFDRFNKEIESGQINMDGVL